MPSNTSLLKQAIISNLEPNAFYEKSATPFRTARQLKLEHARELAEHYQFKGFRANVQRGFEVLFERLPTLMTQGEWVAFLQEFKNLSSAYRDAYIQKEFRQILEQPESEQPTNLQQFFHITDASMGKGYELASQLLQEKDFESAEAVFTVLAYLSPAVSEYKTGIAIALYWQTHYEACVDTLAIPKILQPLQAVNWIYSALSHLHLNEREQAQEDVAKIQEIFSQAPDQKAQWDELYLAILDQLMGGR